ncbi:MAG: hypothetical protein WB989_16625 [Mycobacterium sp.]
MIIASSYSDSQADPGYEAQNSDKNITDLRRKDYFDPRKHR